MCFFTLVVGYFADAQYDVFFNIAKTKNNASQTESLDLRRFVVRVAGVEPVRNCFHKNLNLTRLPVPPYPHGIFAKVNRK